MLKGYSSFIPIFLILFNISYIRCIGSPFEHEEVNYNWSEIVIEDFGIIQEMVINSNNELLLATKYNGILKRDLENNWEEISSVYRSLNTIAIDNDDRIYAGYSYGYGLYVSDKDYLEWNPLKINGDECPIEMLAISKCGNVAGYGSSNFYLFYEDKEYERIPANVFYNGFTGMCVTDDWKIYLSDYALYGDQVAVGLYGGGVNLVKDGKPQKTGLRHISVEDVVSDSKGYIYAGTRSTIVKRYTIFDGCGIQKSCDNGKTWFCCGLDGYDIYSLSICDNDILYAGTKSGEIFFSIDSGNSWISAGIPLEAAVSKIIPDHNSGIYVYADYRLFYGKR